MFRRVWMNSQLLVHHDSPFRVSLCVYLRNSLGSAWVVWPCDVCTFNGAFKKPFLGTIGGTDGEKIQVMFYHAPSTG